MKILRINQIKGIYNEMYSPNVYSFNTEIFVRDSYLDLNQCFWNFILSEKSICKLIDIAKSNSTDEILIPQVYSAINNLEIFIDNINKAKIELCNQNISPEIFFRYLETLEILCYLYSKFLFNGIPFSINEAFIINETSSKKLYYDSTNRYKNPLYDWILNRIMPVINDYNPDLVIFDGKPSIFSFCIAKMIKNKKKSIHICISNTDSEYYSLFKIKKFLVKNIYLFKIFDSIVLKDSSETENKLIHAITNKESLECVNNIIFHKNDLIICNNIKESGDFKLYINNSTNSNTIINVHLLPKMKCYWNKCVFCGINKKYSFENKVNNDIDLYNNLNKLKEHIIKYNIKYIWFIDEAFPIEILKKIAIFFIEEHIKVIWQARCRIEPELLTKGLSTILYNSGLRELRLGLESASKKVLKLMNKFPDNFDISIVDNILKEYHNSGISIHFPMIIGFPGENNEDRRITYEYLENAIKKYDDLTFNLNILYIDISSKLFNNWIDYDIYEIKLPCPASEFLGNIAFSTSTEPISLKNEQDSIMKNLLYPWYPPNALLKPHIFYRLSETIRNTLIWKDTKSKHLIFSIRNNTVILCKNISFYKLKNDQNIIYNWNTHRYIIVNDNFLRFIEKWKEPKNIFDLIEIANLNPVIGFSFSDYLDVCQKLLATGFFETIPENSMESLNNYNNVKKYYNEMYSKKLYDYNIIINSWLKNNINLITKGEVLEIGIGLGQNIDLYIENGFFVHGIDISDIAIKDLQNKYSAKNTKFLCGDITNISLPTNKYNLIVCSMVLHYLSSNDIVRTINNIKKSLNKNGYIYMKFLSTEDSLYEYNSKIIKHFFTKNEVLSLFGDMNIIELTQTIAEDNIRNLDAHRWGIIECIALKI